MTDVIQAARDVVAIREAYNDSGWYHDVPTTIDDSIDNLRSALAELDAQADAPQIDRLRQLVARIRERQERCVHVAYSRMDGFERGFRHVYVNDPHMKPCDMYDYCLKCGAPLTPDAPDDLAELVAILGEE